MGMEPMGVFLCSAFVVSTSVSLYYGVVLVRGLHELWREWARMRRRARERVLADASLVSTPGPPPTDFEKHLFAVEMERMRDEGWTVHALSSGTGCWAVLEPWRLKEKQPELPFPKKS